jgi:hypothetical protein
MTLEVLTKRLCHHDLLLLLLMLVSCALKVYQALFALATRDFPRAATLFLDSIATFTT